jgi:hypothetical protein
LYPTYEFRASGLSHDIALIELDAPLGSLTGEHVIDPVKATSLLRPGIRIDIVGYGAIGADGQISAATR